MTALPPNDDDVDDWFDGSPRVHGALRWLTYLVVFWILAGLVASLSLELWRSS